MMRQTESARRRARLIACRRSSVSMFVALMAPVLAAASGLGVEVSNWTVEQMRMQRAADVAAVSGAAALNAGATAQAAATAAARMAEINGVSGTASPTWNSGTRTLTDNKITVQVITGVKNTSDTALRVSVQENVALGLTRMVSTQSAVTISASSTAELVASGTGNTGPQPCMFALSTSGNGISASGYINVNAPGCSLVSNNNINFSGGGTFTTSGLYATNSINIPSWVTITGGTKHPNNGTLTDPYLGNTTLQNALTAAKTATGSSIACTNQNCSLPTSSGSTFNGSYCSGQGTGSVTCYLKPGNYANWTALSGGPYTFNMSPGLYVFNGVIDLENNTTTNGSGVTILVTGNFTGKNSFNFNVTAPSSTDVANTGGIAGVALAGTTTGAVTMSGNPQFIVDGVVYFPNALFDDSNSPTLGNSTNTCLEILASSITLSGSIWIKSNCSAVNAQSFGSTPGATTYKAALVQ
jgi:hypothetical protein